jgi:hypothetical protein
MSVHRRRFKGHLPPVPVVCPPVVNPAVVVRGERRNVATFFPDGRIIWQGWNEHQTAITENIIRHKVATVKDWKP